MAARLLSSDIEYDYFDSAMNEGLNPIDLIAFDENAQHIGSNEEYDYYVSLLIA